MHSHRSTVILLSVLYFANYVFPSEMNSRQKRCIVVQKQSGTHGDSTEGGGEEERTPEPRGKADRRRVPDPLDSVRDVEDIPQNLLKYRNPPTKKFPIDLLRYLNRVYKNHL